jgi:predicted TPR repeat methyltransferase
VPGDQRTDPVLDEARAYFDAFADDYDEAAVESEWAADRPLVDALGRIRPVRTALDLACGTGSTLAVLRDAWADAALTGVDLSAAMVERARSRVPSARVVQADANSYASSAVERFDLVTSVGGFEFVDDLPGLLHAVRRIVRPGGHLVFTYEPLIAGWEPQSRRRETNLGSTGHHLTTFRWEPGEVVEGFSDWRLEQSRLVAAYLRDGVPVVYGWMHYRRGA